MSMRPVSVSLKAPCDCRPRLPRRRFLAACGWGALALVERYGFSAPNSAPSVAEAFDREVERFMQARQVPGGALAVCL